MVSARPAQEYKYFKNYCVKYILLFSMKTSGQYEKPLSGSRGFPQLACSPGICRLITVLIPFLDTNTQTNKDMNTSSPLRYCLLFVRNLLRGKQSCLYLLN